MIRALVLVATLAASLAGCANRSQVGPYVKSVARTGEFLAVIKCFIVLEAEELREEACTIEHIPLRSIPMQPPGQGAAPGATPR